MLEALITSKARIAILRLFHQDEKKRYHLREVSRILGINVNQAQRELGRLERAGILKKEKVGSAHCYYLDKGYRFHKELSSIIRKSIDIGDMIASEIRGIEGIRIAFIFGSFAEGRLGKGSDIDLMIVGGPDLDDLNEAIGNAEKSIRRQIQYMVYPIEEFRKKSRYGFMKNVLSRKRRFIVGDENELERIKKKEPD